MYDYDLTAASFRGAAELETTARGLRPHRLPAWVRNQFPEPQLLTMEGQPSGVRIVLATAARTIELVVNASRVAYRDAERARGAIDLVIDGASIASSELTGGDRIEVDLRTGATQFVPGDVHVAVFGPLDEGHKMVELWLPHNESVELIGLRTDLPAAAVEPDRPVWLHHGSSISHGSNAATPTQIWPAVASRLGGVDLRNLGFGGSAMVDPFTARVVRDSSADFISVKLGINVVNADAMRLRAFVPGVHGFLDTIREGHSDTPLVLVSPILADIHEDTPGPGAIDPASLGTDQVRFRATGTAGDTALGRLTLRVIREALASIVEARRRADPNVHYLDGLSLYGPEDADHHPLPDGLHPDSATHAPIGQRFAQYAFSPTGPFSSKRSARRA